jgi:hypothetical protein
VAAFSLFPNMVKPPSGVSELQVIDSGNIRRRFRTRSKLSSVATEADPRRNNLCGSHLGPRGHRRGAFAIGDLPPCCVAVDRAAVKMLPVARVRHADLET